MNKYLNKEIEFIPEVYKDGYLIGHTENYLLIKTKGKEELLGKTIKVKTNKIDYPHLISEICICVNNWQVTVINDKMLS